MKKYIVLLVSLVWIASLAAKDNLAILPFTGGEDEDGATVAELFSFSLNDVFGTGIMETGTSPAASQSVTPPAAPPTPPKPADPTQFWSIGALLGTTFYAPAFTITLQGTLAPFPYSFFEIGADLGLGLMGESAANYSHADDVSYYSFYPYLHANRIIVLPTKFPLSIYAGAGAGVMLATYKASDSLTQRLVVVGMDVIFGMLLWNWNINVTFRANFEALSASVRLAAGYSIRF
jgi:hypothetical protein